MSRATGLLAVILISFIQLVTLFAIGVGGHSPWLGVIIAFGCAGSYGVGRFVE